MNLETAAIIICVLAALGLGFIIPVLIELRRTIAQANTFMKTTEKDLAATLKETEHTLKSLRGITENINTITGDVTNFSGGISGAAHDLRLTAKHMEKLVNRLSSHFSGLRAAMSAAAGILINSLKGDRK